jgi:transposase-like protein
MAVSTSVTALTDAKRRNRSIEARRAAPRAKFERERVIVDYLNRGVSVAEIAGRIGVTEKRMRALVKEILARRMPAAPEDFAALQASRLNEALMVAYGAMSAENLKAVALVVRIVRELDRYHGFFPAERRSSRDAEATAEEPPACAAKGSQMAPQALENAQNTPGDGGAEAGTEAARPRLAQTAPDAIASDAPPADGQRAPQASEEARSAPENDEPEPAGGEAVAFLSAPAEAADAPDARAVVGPETATQVIDNAHFAPGNGAPSGASDESLRSRRRPGPRNPERVQTAARPGGAQRWVRQLIGMRECRIGQTP